MSEGTMSDDGWEFRWHGPEDINLDDGDTWISVDGWEWRRHSEGGWETRKVEVHVAVSVDFEGHEPRECGEHRTLGPHRAWCFACSEYCYPRIEMACRGCEIPFLRAEIERLKAGRDEGIDPLSDELLDGLLKTLPEDSDVVYEAIGRYVVHRLETHREVFSAAMRQISKLETELVAAQQMIRDLRA